MNINSINTEFEIDASENRIIVENVFTENHTAMIFVLVSILSDKYYNIEIYFKNQKTCNVSIILLIRRLLHRFLQIRLAIIYDCKSFEYDLFDSFQHDICDEPERLSFEYTCIN